MPLFFKGTIRGIRPKTYEGKTTYILQFLEDRPDGSIDKYDIKLPDNVAPTNFDKGQETSVPILISSMNGNMYYRVDGVAFNAAVPAKR
jgi:hypothetical protein